MTDVNALFDEFAAAYVRGDQPDIRALLARAGDGADELARLVDVFLQVAPAPEPTDDDVAVMGARLEGEPGLLALRTRRGRKVDEVVAELAGRLAVDDLPRLRSYYQRLENGTLDPGPVDQRIWDALRELFAANVRAIVRPVATMRGESAMAYYRRTGPASGGRLPEDSPGAAPAARPQTGPALRADPAPTERDHLDRLFLG